MEAEEENLNTEQMKVNQDEAEEENQQEHLKTTHNKDDQNAAENKSKSSRKSKTGASQTSRAKRLEERNRKIAALEELRRQEAERLRTDTENERRLAERRREIEEQRLRDEAARQAEIIQLEAQERHRQLDLQLVEEQRRLTLENIMDENSCASSTEHSAVIFPKSTRSSHLRKKNVKSLPPQQSEQQAVSSWLRDQKRTAGVEQSITAADLMDIDGTPPCAVPPGPEEEQTCKENMISTDARKTQPQQQESIKGKPPVSLIPGSSKHEQTNGKSDNNVPVTSKAPIQSISYVPCQNVPIKADPPFSDKSKSECSIKARLTLPRRVAEMIDGKMLASRQSDQYNGGTQVDKVEKQLAKPRFSQGPKVTDRVPAFVKSDDNNAKLKSGPPGKQSVSNTQPADNSPDGIPVSSLKEVIKEVLRSEFTFSHVNVNVDNGTVAQKPHASSMVPPSPHNDTHHTSSHDVSNASQSAAPSSLAEIKDQMMIDVMKRFSSEVDAGRDAMVSLAAHLSSNMNHVPPFSGDVLEYPQFVRDYDHACGKLPLSNAEKFNKLLEVLKGPALKLLDICKSLPDEQAYIEARAILHDHYSKPQLVKSAWLKKLRSKKPSSVRDVMDDMANCIRALSGTAVEHEMNSEAIISACLDRLPHKLYWRWRTVASRHRLNEGTQPTLEMLYEEVWWHVQEAEDPEYGDDWARSRGIGVGRGRGTQFSRPTSLAMEGNVTVRAPPRSGSYRGQSSRGKPSSAHSRNTDHTKSDTKPPANNPSSQPLKSDSNTKYPCTICESTSHFPRECPTLKAIPDLEDREKIVRDKHLCFSCFRRGHQLRECRLGFRCGVQGCKMRHAPVLHGRSFPIRPKTEPEVEGETISAAVYDPLSKRVALPVLPVRVTNPSTGNSIITHCVLDSASTVTLCEQSLFDQLGIVGKFDPMSLKVVGSEHGDIPSSSASLLVSSVDGSEELTLHTVRTTPSLPITGKSCATKSDVQNYAHLRDLPLLDYRPDSVPLLIGLDHSEALAVIDCVKGEKGGPFAHLYMFGWAVCGTSQSYHNKHNPDHYTVLFTHSEPSSYHDIDSKLERLWQWEDSQFYDQRRGLSAADKSVIELWEKETKQSVKGHYILPIPFRKPLKLLPDNRGQAVIRLTSLQRRLAKDPELNQKYSDNIKSMLDKGYAERVPRVHTGVKGQIWYIPHHAVVTPSKPKPRIVFDAAAKRFNVSLNDVVLSGPDLTNSLLGVLIRFRSRPVAFMCDISEMFYQVRVPPEQRDFLRFLWTNNGGKTEEYRMCVHVFGGTWCPAAANYALRRTAEDFGNAYDPSCATAVSRSFYVDDCLHSTDTIEEAEILIQQLPQLLMAGGFVLHKWASNVPDLLSNLPDEVCSKATQQHRISGDSLDEHALGVFWKIEEDCFSFTAEVKVGEKTKRGILSVLSSVFDPLGLVSPYILQARLLVQELCRRKLDWDDQIPDELCDDWSVWVQNLPAVRKLVFTRCVQPSWAVSGVAHRTLHHFCDASEAAYGVCSYLVVESTDGRVESHLVMAKSRLAPLKHVTIPRLELQAAVLATRVHEVLSQEFDLPLDPPVFWTDAAIVLAYIKAEERRFHTYVANRVSEIRSRSSPDSWRHVPGDLNPADDASRGCFPDTLEGSRWQHGPSFLRQSSSNLPRFQEGTVNLDDDPEVRKEVPVSAAVERSVHFSYVNTLLERSSSWCKSVRVMAWLLVHISRFRGGKKKSLPNLPHGLDVSWLQAAERELIYAVQSEAYSAERVALLKDEDIPRSSSLVKLDPWLIDNLIVVGGRLSEADVDTRIKHPPVLPGKHPISLLIMRETHNQAHMGVEYTLAAVRQEFWITGATTLAKRVVSHCVPCKRMAPRPQPQLMGNLPSERVNPGGPCFTHVGLDMFGPIHVRNHPDSPLVKRYVCLYTCLKTRAVHLELLHDADTDSFVQALFRFIARRGLPQLIRSDNGSNFVGGNKKFQQMVSRWNHTRIRSQLAAMNVEWKFNPPRTPHMGGVWERLVKIAKRALVAVSKGQIMSDETARTFLAIVESMMNDRPLTSVSEDPRDYKALTPNNFLLLRSGDVPLTPTNHADGLKRHWRQTKALAHMFWRRWNTEYITTLQKRTKWQRRHVFEVGDVVLVQNPPSASGTYGKDRWPLGLIVGVHPGPDNMIRVVTVRVGGKETKRSVNQLALLERPLLMTEDVDEDVA